MFSSEQPQAAAFIFLTLVSQQVILQKVAPATAGDKSMCKKLLSISVSRLSFLTPIWRSGVDVISIVLDSAVAFEL